MDKQIESASVLEQVLRFMWSTDNRPKTVAMIQRDTGLAGGEISGAVQLATRKGLMRRVNKPAGAGTHRSTNIVPPAQYWQLTEAGVEEGNRLVPQEEGEPE